MNRGHPNQSAPEIEVKSAKTMMSCLSSPDRKSHPEKPQNLEKEKCIITTHLFFFSFFFYYSYVHTRIGSFLPTAPTPSLTTHSTPSPSPPNTQQKLFCPYF
jgi:hypothetical protein